MRIIAGEHRGRQLLGPEGRQTTRPITDRAKQSVFDILAPLIEGAVVYDCFCGTGSMGLECLSRGAARAVFFDADRSALARLRRNIEALGVDARSRVVAGDVFRHFAASPAPQMADAADLVFLDPPYRTLRQHPGQLQTLGGALAAHLKPEATVIFRHDARDALPLPPLRVQDRREYGGMLVEFLRPEP